MSVEATHKAYVTAKAGWQKVRDFVAGGDKARAYVKTLPGHNEATATSYKSRAYYLPAIARSVDAFTGLIMNPEPVITGAEAIQPYLDDVSYDGEPAARMIGRTVREVIEVGRCAAVADYPQDPNAATMTVAEAEAKGLRAYVRFYPAESVLDWRVTNRGGQRILSMLKLREDYEAQSTVDEWLTVKVEQIRVLDLVAKTDGAFRYRQRIYRKGEVEIDGKKAVGWTQVGNDIFPQAGGAELDEIPAVVFNPDTLDPSAIDASPIAEMVDIADSHLQDSAGLQWALMWIGNPTPIFIDLMVAEGETVALGSSQGLRFNQGGDAKFLALGADGVGAIRQAMEDKRRDMASVGARMLVEDAGAQVARDTVIIQRAGEHSVLANIANTVADGWKRMLGYLARWAGVSNADISVSLNTDFVPQGLQPGELGELISAVMQGQLSSRDLFAILQKRGTVRADKSYDEHREEIDEDGALMLNAPPAVPAQGDPNDPNAEDNNQPQDGAQ